MLFTTLGKTRVGNLTSCTTSNVAMLPKTNREVQGGVVGPSPEHQARPNLGQSSVRVGRSALVRFPVAS